MPFSNASRYHNPEADRLLSSAAVETGTSRRRRDFPQPRTVVARDPSDINFLTDFHYALHDKRLFGHATRARPDDEFLESGLPRWLVRRAGNDEDGHYIHAVAT